nr:trichohyalin-like [Labrus bergylta]
MESSIEASPSAGISQTKPALTPKPRLAPKPFSLQKNSNIRSINAPKTVSSTTKKTLQKTIPSPAQQTPASDSKPSPVSVLNTKNQQKTTTDTIDSGVGKSDPSSQTAPPKETPESELIEKDDVIQIKAKASTVIEPESEQIDGKKKEEEKSDIKKLEKSDGDVSSAFDPKCHLGSIRKRLPTELTSKFESGGPCLPPQPSKNIPTIKNIANKPESSDPDQSPRASEPSNTENEEGGLKEDYGGGGSIKRRISLLFDSSSRPEVMAKRDEPEIVNGTGGVKARIKNWVTETNSETEKKPQVVHRGRSKSFEPGTSLTEEETPEKPNVEPPASKTSSSEEVDHSSRASPAEQPTDTPTETSEGASTENKSSEILGDPSEERTQNKSNEGEVQLRNRSRSLSQTATDEGDSAASQSLQCSLKRGGVKRRSVHFGVVERDDGGPPVPLGSDPDSSEGEEEEAPKDDTEEETPESIPVYRRVGSLQKKNDEAQREEEERLKHVEFEKRRRAEEHEQANLEIEQERKRKEEEEREKEKARQREEEERERVRLREEEMERKRKEEWEAERFKEEERARERQREEDMERERQMELMLKRQREEEKEKARQEEERLKKEQEEKEKERLKEEERLREERERERLREEEKRFIREQEEKRIERKLTEEEMNLEKQREEEWEKEWLKKTEELGGEKGEEERGRETELMWQRQKEERQRQEEMEKERLREEAEKNEQKRLKEQQQKEEMERMREIEMEKLRLEEERQKREKKAESSLPPSAKKSESQIEVVYDDFSVKQPLMDVDFDDFSVKPKRWGSQAKAEASPATRRWEEDPAEKQEVEALVPMEVSQGGNKEPDSPLPTLTQKSPVEEEKEREEKETKEALEEETTKEDEEDKQELPDSPKHQPHLSVCDDPDSNGVLSGCTTISLSFFFFFNMQYFGGKLSAAQLQMAGLVGSMRRSLQGALDLVWGTAEEKQEEEEEDKEEEVEEEGGGDSGGRFQRAVAPLRSFARRSRRSLRRFSVRSRQTLQRTSTESCSAQVNSYGRTEEDKDTDALIDNEPDQQREAREEPSEITAPEEAPEGSPERSPEDADMTDFHTVEEPAPFPESSNPLLDTSVQRSKADLGKRRIRSRPSKVFRSGLSAKESPDWRCHDSTDEKEANQKDSDSEEEQPQLKKVSTTPPSSKRVPVFPGLSPSSLIAKLKRRTGGGRTGGGEQTEEDKGREEKESQKEEDTAPSPSLLSRSPRSPAHLAGAARVLPPIGGADKGAVASPAWLKELKSKKRLSQYDGEA